MSFETFAVAAYTYYPVVWRKVYDDALRASHLCQPEATELDVLLMRVTGDAEKHDVFNGNKTIIALKNSTGADLSTYSNRKSEIMSGWDNPVPPIQRRTL